MEVDAPNIDNHGNSAAGDGRTDQGLSGNGSPTHWGQDRWAAAANALDWRDRELLQPIVAEAQPAAVIIADILQRTDARKTECLKRRWKVKLWGREVVIRDLLDKISSWISKFLQIGDVLIQIDPVHAAAPWAAVRLIMQTAISDFETFGFVLAAIERLTNHIAMCAIFELQYLQPEHNGLEAYSSLSRAVTKLYEGMLSFLCTALRYYKLGSFVRHLKSIVTSKADMEAKYKPIDAAQILVNDLAKLADAQRRNLILERVGSISLHNETQNQEASQRAIELQSNLIALRGPISRSASHLEQLADNLERETRVRILKSISAIPCYQHHKDAAEKRLKGSGKWLFEKKTFQEWRCESSSSQFWLHGIPGSGKTTLTSLVIETLRRDHTLAYFYCDRSPSDPARSQGSKILASLVRQLACVSPGMPILEPVRVQYQREIDGFEEFEDHIWSVKDCENVMKDLLELYPATTIVIDALDEVQFDDRQVLLDVFNRLMAGTANLLKIFISSRDNYDIAQRLEGSSHINIQAADNQQDIENFITYRVNNARLLNGRLAEDLKNEIISVLTRGAQGMFRWVELQIKSFVGLKMAGDIAARLGKLPASLEESYWVLYQQILASGEHSSKLAIFVFRWLLYTRAETPVSDLATIASSTLAAYAADDEGVAAGYAGQVTPEDIIDVCETFVIRQQWLSSDCFVFAHLSVREFLEALHLRQVGSMDPGVSYSVLATACLGHILRIIRQKVNESADDRVESAADCSPDAIIGDLDPLAAPPSSFVAKIGQDLVKIREGNYFTIYTAVFWTWFARQSGSFRTEMPLSKLVRELVINERNPAAVSEIFQIWSYLVNQTQSLVLVGNIAADPPSPIWLAISYNWDDVIKMIYEHNNYEGINSKRRIFSHTGELIESNPFSYAMRMRKYGLAATISRSCGHVALADLDLSERRRLQHLSHVNVELGSLLCEAMDKGEFDRSRDNWRDLWLQEYVEGRLLEKKEGASPGDCPK